MAGAVREGRTPIGIIGAMAAGAKNREPGSEGARERGSAAEAVAADAAEKLRALEDRLAKLGSVMVAYSGGVDSAFLAATAHHVLGERMLAVLADSPSLARRDMEQACAFAQSLGMPLEVIATEELDRPEYARNDANRCFHCKDELFLVMEKLAGRAGFSHIAYGMNADDTRDFRPGQRAAEQHEVLAPLAEAGLTKLEVRALAKAAGYPMWDRPAAPCLSSRVEYGRTVTREVLEQVELGRGEFAAAGLSRVPRAPSWRTGSRGDCTRRAARRTDDGDAGRDHGGTETGGVQVRGARLPGISLRGNERSAACRGVGAKRRVG